MLRFNSAITLLSLLIFPLLAVAQTETETLNQAYYEMLSSNPNLIESKANQRAAYQAYLQIRGGFFPKIDVAYNVGRGKGISVSPQTLVIGYTTTDIQHKQITLTQLLFDGGATLHRMYSAGYRYRSARYEKDYQMNQLALRTAAAYLALLRSQEMEKIAHDKVRMHEIKFGQTRERFKGGAGTLAENTLAASRLQESYLVWNKSKLEVANAEANYETVIGHRPTDKLVVPADVNLSAETLAEFECKASSINPSILSARELIRSARHDVHSMHARAYSPNITLNLSGLRDNNLNGIESRTVSMQGYIAVNYNIFNGGTDKAAIGEAAARYVASKANLETKRRDVILSVQQTWNELQMSERDQMVLKRRLKVTEDMVYAFNQELKLGKRSLLDVMTTENEYYDVRASLVDVKYKIKIDKYALLANTGQLANYLSL